MSVINFFREYKPPKKLRALFIVHYSPLLLMIMIGPLTAIYGLWELPIDIIISIIFGGIIFSLGAFVFFRWEIYWKKPKPNATRGHWSLTTFIYYCVLALPHSVRSCAAL